MKLNRHAKIVELVRKHNIETQEELAEYLRKEGFQVTQATVSRDIRDLNLTKMQGKNGKQYYVANAMTSDQNAGVRSEDIADKYLRILKGAYVSCDLAANLVVIKTSSGMASAVAAVIDDLHWSEIVGSIAGDDTIMCATRGEGEAQLVLERLQKIVLS